MITLNQRKHQSTQNLSGLTKPTEDTVGPLKHLLPPLGGVPSASRGCLRASLAHLWPLSPPPSLAAETVVKVVLLRKGSLDRADFIRVLTGQAGTDAFLCSFQCQGHPPKSSFP